MSEPTTKVRGGTKWLLLPAVGYQALFFLIPILIIAWESFFEPSFGLDHYAEALTNPVYAKVLWQTLKLAFWVTLISVMLGYPVAYFIASRRGVLSSLVLLAVLVPLWTSILVKTYSFQVLLGREGIVNDFLLSIGVTDQPLPLMFNAFTAITGMVHALMPFVILPCYAVMRNIQPELSDAARSLGASPTRAFWRVYFPLTTPGLVTAVILTFVLGLGFFVTPVILGGVDEFTIAGLIQLQMQGTLNWSLGGALSILLLATTGLIVYLYQRRYGLDQLLGGGAV